YSRAEAVGALRLADLLAEPVTQGGTGPSERVYIKKDGTTFVALSSVREQRSRDGRLLAVFEMGVDISEQKEHEAQAREEQALVESIALNSPTISYIFDLQQRRIVYSNRPLGTMLGFSEEEIAEMGPDPLPPLMYPEDLDILYNRYLDCERLEDGAVLDVEFRCISAAGELRWLQTRDVVFKRDAQGNPSQILVNVVDTTERKLLDEQVQSQVLEIHDTNLALEIQTNALEEANSQLESLAFTDGLTGIANHRAFQEELARNFEISKRKKHKLSLLLIDVDRFKDYNDTYGHPCGDIVLKHVAWVIRDSCPEGCLPARYGGEEFAVICPKITAKELLALAESIRSAVEHTPWPERPVTISIGAASTCPVIASASELVNAADAALYTSKANGRNRVTYSDPEHRQPLAG
ncbi:MAG TPA: sensor domain-containing diguanylate cyclase, partial [Fimbriimonadaceae bacterium]|nr:sensor domain-containing diguanylate cyclase [Fimbriimonadaceae bacterium]